jgi:hypothetical protein
MSHEEIASRFMAPRTCRRDVASEANQKMLKARDSWLSKGRALWLRIQPLSVLEIPFRSEDDFRKYFADPLVTGNRAAGWTRESDARAVRYFMGPKDRLYRDGAIASAEAAHISA